MKLKTASLPLLALPLLATLAYGQNLFRTGRPDYTRRQAANYQDRFTNLTTPSSQEARSNEDRRQDSVDRERLQQAWESYRREADRYYARYGNQNGASTSNVNQAVRYSASSSNSVSPVDFESDWVPRGPRKSNPYDATRSTPVPTYDRNSDDYSDQDYQNSDYTPRSEYTPRRDYSQDWNRNASRPLTSFLDSLFGTSR